MRIAHNISAINSYNKLYRNNKVTGDVLEKLSSGLSINKVADDAAGLAISEKMRAQIRGLGQAERNIQDGISLIQTAESGLGAIQDHLQRIRELAIQASNDTLTNEDRRQTQKEVSQIKQGINEIANNTHFNGIDLLNGTEGNRNFTPIQGSISVNWTNNISSGELSRTSDGGYIGVSTYPGSTTFKIDNTGKLVWSQSISNMEVFSVKETSDGGYITLGNDFYADPNSVDKINIIKWDRNRNEQWRTGVTGVYSIQGNEVIETSNGSFVIVGVGSGIQNWDGLIAKFNSSGTQLSSSVTGSSQSTPLGYGHDEFKKIIETADGGFLAIGTSSLKVNGTYSDNSNWVVKYDSNLNLLWEKRVGSLGDDEGYDAIATSDGGAIIVGSYNDSTKTSGLIYKVDSSGNMVWEKNISATTSILSRIYGISTGNNGNYLAGGELDGKSYLWLFDPEGNELARFSLSDNSAMNLINSIIHNHDGSYTVSTTGGIMNINLAYRPNNDTSPNYKKLLFQVGANSGNQYSIELTDARTTALGIDGIDLSIRQSAESAIIKIDKAIEKVSSARSMYGAHQNALEHIQNNVSNYYVQLTAAESRIRDVDMAKEMMEYTKTYIFVQVSQAMLAHANQQPQEILQLLK
ncbi:flagellin [Paenibacillus faecalis]|uniref:flagellin n=1 Tax=Paenibacillus faecalis TaxID=2079532 RepID=UPI000D112E20|nr:flagellin [Paenibacillus faecalis]